MKLCAGGGDEEKADEYPCKCTSLDLTSDAVSATLLWRLAIDATSVVFVIEVVPSYSGPG